MASQLTLAAALVALVAINAVAAYGPYGLGYEGLYWFALVAFFSIWFASQIDNSLSLS